MVPGRHRSGRCIENEPAEQRAKRCVEEVTGPRPGQRVSLNTEIERGEAIRVRNSFEKEIRRI